MIRSPFASIRLIATACFAPALFLLSWPVLATSASTEEAPDLEAADRAYNAAATNRDRESFVAMLDPRASFFAEDLHQGRDAFVAGWGPLWTGKYDFSYEATTLEATVAESGELGFTLGAVKTRFRRPGLDEDNVTDAHYVNVWTREDGGAWRLRIGAPLVVHPEWGAAREPRTGLMTAWPQLADLVGAAIEIRWRPEAVMRAESGDLVVSSGTYQVSFEEADASQAGGGHFVAVWQKDEAGRWQLAAEGFTPPALDAAASSRAETGTSPGTR